MVALNSTCSWLDDCAEVIRENENDRGANHLYSVAALTDNTGAVVERYRYDAYGQRIVLAGDGVTLRWGSSYGNQVGFTGRYLDKETGLWYFRARYYSGSLGKFVSRDPRMAKPFRDHGKVEVRKVRGKDVAVLTVWGPSGADGYQDGMSLYSGYFVPNALDPLGESVYEWCCKRGCDAAVVGLQVIYGAAAIAVAAVITATGGATTVVVAGFVYTAVNLGTGYDPVGDAISAMNGAWNGWVGAKWSECYRCCEEDASGCEELFYQN